MPKSKGRLRPRKQPHAPASHGPIPSPAEGHGLVRAGWVQEHNEYTDDPVTGPAPHNPRHDGGTCHRCSRWRLACERGITCEELDKMTMDLKE